MKKFPYLVAIEEGQIVGYAYASTYYARAPMIGRWNCRSMFKKEARGKGWNLAIHCFGGGIDCAWVQNF